MFGRICEPSDGLKIGMAMPERSRKFLDPGDRSGNAPVVDELTPSRPPLNQCELASIQWVEHMRNPKQSWSIA
jgi:hypothetical protein